MNSIWMLDRNGEIENLKLNHGTRMKYKADTPMDKSFVPYLVMLFCAVVDATVFLSLFKMISYDSPFMLAIQVSGFLFAFDVVPIYLGIHLRRLKQGLTSDRFIMWLAVGVCALACLMNIGLRILTIHEMAPPDLSGAATSYYGTVVDASAQSSGIDSAAIALTIFGIGVPILTSIGSFFISYLTYDPLRVRLQRQDEMIAEKWDEIRRLKAILCEYEADEGWAEKLIADDERRCAEMARMHKALTISYCDYVRQCLKEHLKNPTSHNVLSQETCLSILDRLDRELTALYPEEYQQSSKAVIASIEPKKTAKIETIA